jgi:hypothetical protein
MVELVTNQDAVCWRDVAPGIVFGRKTTAVTLATVQGQLRPSNPIV